MLTYLKELTLLYTQGSTLLHKAAVTGDLHTAKLYLGIKPTHNQINTINNAGDSAISLAVRNGRIEIVRLLVPVATAPADKSSLLEDATKLPTSKQRTDMVNLLNNWK